MKKQKADWFIMAILIGLFYGIVKAIVVVIIFAVHKDWSHSIWTLIGGILFAIFTYGAFYVYDIKGYLIYVRNFITFHWETLKIKSFK